MKKTYTTTTEIWRFGLPVAPGTDLSLNPIEAKYLGHALVEKTDDPTPAPAAEVLETDDAEIVESKPHAKKRK